MRQLTVILVALCLTPVALGQEVPLGDQFQVNTTTYRVQQDPAVARDDDGNFVIVWANDNTPTWIAGQRFSPGGTPAGSEFQVNTLLGDEVELPQVAMAGDGRFVVVWHDTGGLDGSSYSVRGQRYAADGTPVGSEMQINSYTNSVQGWPSVAMRDDGSFVVVWIGEGTHDSDGVHGQAFGWDGLSLWGEFGINDFISGTVHYPDVEINDNDRFVVVWKSSDSPGGDHDGSIQVRCFPWGGVVPAPQQQVNTTTEGDQYQSAVAVAPDGSFLVVYNLAGNTVDVGGQRFDSSCAPAGGEFVVNTTPDHATWPDVAVDDQGRFVAVWGYSGIFGRLFQADGTPVDDEFIAPSHDFLGEGHPTVAAAPDGQFVAAWTSYGSVGDDDDINCIQARRFGGLAGIFVDGFDGGDTTAWTDTSP